MLHVQDHPPRSILGHHLPLGGERARRRAIRRARALRDAAPARRQRAHSADRRRLRPRARHDHDGDPGARQDHTGDAGSLQGRRRVRRLRGSPRAAAAREPRRARGAGRRRARCRAGLPAAARLQGGRQPRHRHHRLPQQGPGVLGGQVREVLRRADRLHRRRQLRPSRLRHRGAQRRDRARPPRPRRGDRPAADDERLRRDHPAVGRASTMVSLNAIMVDGTGMCGSCRVTRRQRDQVRLRRRPRLRRPPGRLQGADAAPDGASRARRRRPPTTTRTSATSRSSCSTKASATTRSTRTCRRTR